MLSGIILGIVFGAANTYLGLKAGLTISTSIPVAVLTVVAFPAAAAPSAVKHSILEANMSQTIGSASSSVASGVLFTIPGAVHLGHEPGVAPDHAAGDVRRPDRRAGDDPAAALPDQAGARQAAVPRGHGLRRGAGRRRGRRQQAAPVFWGIGVGMLFKLLTDGFKVVAGKFQLALPVKADRCRSASRRR